MALVPFPGSQAGVPSPLPPDEDDDSPGAGKMSFLEHLDELRKRIVRACLAIAIGVLVTFYWIQPIFNFILAPTRKALPPGVKLIYTQPGEAFSLYITVALIAGVVVSSLFLRVQTGRDEGPHLVHDERRRDHAAGDEGNRDVQGKRLSGLRVDQLHTRREGLTRGGQEEVEDRT